MDGTRISKIALEYKAKSRRDDGRPGKRWGLWSRNRPEA